MCGIGAFFARESVPDFKSIMKPMCNAYLDYNNRRHIDSIIIRPVRPDDIGNKNIKPSIIEWDCDHNIQTEIEGNYWESFEMFFSDNMKVGDLLIFGIGTEVRYFKDEQIVIANNSSNVRTFKDPKVNTLEYLVELYKKNQRDMKRTLEACDQCDINLLASDIKKMNLMSANDGHAGIQMCHAYIKGIGFMLHQNMVCLRNIIHDFTDCSQDAVNLWETWYGHPLEGEVIRETDLESGSMRKIKFNPKWSY